MVSFAANPPVGPSLLPVGGPAKPTAVTAQISDAWIREARDMALSEADSHDPRRPNGGMLSSTGTEPTGGLDRMVAAVREVFGRYPDCLLANSALGSFRDSLERQVLQAVQQAYGPECGVGVTPLPSASMATGRHEAADWREAAVELAPGSRVGDAPVRSVVVAAGAVSHAADPHEHAPNASFERALDDGTRGAPAAATPPRPMACVAAALSAALPVTTGAVTAPPPPTAYLHAADAADAVELRWQALLAQEQEAADADPSVPLARGVSRARRYPPRCRSTD